MIPPLGRVPQWPSILIFSASPCAPEHAFASLLPQCQLATGSAPSAGGGCGTPPAGATTFGYDTRGNRTSRTPPGVAPVTYGYDQANRMTSTSSAPGATYRYRGDGLRLAKTVGGVTTTFNWDESGPLPLLVSETTNGNTTRYVYDDKGVPLLQVRPDGVRTYMHHDQLGSVRMLTQDGATVTGTFAYDAYGKRTASTGTVTTPFGFAGEYTDAETGFVYLRARYYDPATGQFLTRDPRVSESGHPYAYANNSPLNFTDPSGEIAWFAAAAVVWAVAEVALAVADAVSTAKTFADPCASGLDKLMSGGLFAMGVGLPGGAYSTAGRAADDFAGMSGLLRSAAKGKGNFGIGSATAAQAEDLGRAWVGSGYRVASDGKTLLSSDGLRQYRPPSLKPNLGRTQANFETRYRPEGQWQANGHLDITP